MKIQKIQVFYQSIMMIIIKKIFHFHFSKFSSRSIIHNHHQFDLIWFESKQIFLLLHFFIIPSNLLSICNLQSIFFLISFLNKKKSSWYFSCWIQWILFLFLFVFLINWMQFCCWAKIIVFKTFFSDLSNQIKKNTGNKQTNKILLILISIIQIIYGF